MTGRRYTATGTGTAFQEYLRKAPDGAENQGWKDSGNAIVDEAGRQVRGPIALCELQGYHYDALCRTAEVEEARGIIDVGDRFLLHRLPEVFAGIGRDQAGFPVQYRDANVPQAWAAGSVFALLQAIVGVQPDAAAGVLYLDPALPDWLPDLELSNLRVGRQAVTLRLRRGADGGTLAELAGADGVQLVRRPLGASLGELQE